MGKITSEKHTVELMINLYCRKKHGTKSLCTDCEALKDYALKQLDKCSFGDDKPACKDCKVHCYNPLQREKIREVMRYSGPRMLFYFPFEYLRHQIRGRILNNRKN
jgi:hypothetical protein